MLPPVFLWTMRFEKDSQAGVIICGTIIAQGILILVALGLGAKAAFLDAPPRFPLAFLFAICAIYMLVRLPRFLRLYGLWRNAWLEMGDDRIRGYGADEKLRHGKAFDIPAEDLENAEITTVPMSRNTGLDGMKITTGSETYIVVGLTIDEETRRAFRRERY